MTTTSVREIAARSWPHFRAVLIAFHIVAVGLLAFPAPGGGMNRSAWADPTVQAEFEVWREWFAGFGVIMSAKDFEDRLYSAAKLYMDGREVVLVPFKPYYSTFGTYQSWRMFVGPATFPSRLYIDVRENDQWRTIYEERNWSVDWNGWQIDHDRMRSATFRYAFKSYHKTEVQFAEWIAKGVARDFPDADRVRVRYWQVRSPTPAESRSGDYPTNGKWISTVEKPLAPYRTVTP